MGAFLDRRPPGHHWILSSNSDHRSKQGTLLEKAPHGDGSFGWVYHSFYSSNYLGLGHDHDPLDVETEDRTP